jgi:hypothetical protein
MFIDYQEILYFEGNSKMKRKILKIAHCIFIGTV